MRLKEIEIGQAVNVKRGYAIRPAVVTSLRNGCVNVRFTDVDSTALDHLPVHRSNLFGATVRPFQVQPQKEQ